MRLTAVWLIPVAAAIERVHQCVAFDAELLVYAASEPAQPERPAPAESDQRRWELAERLHKLAEDGKVTEAGRRELDRLADDLCFAAPRDRLE